jgi:hypothetical protein
VCAWVDGRWTTHLMWVHPIMDLGYPTTKVVYLIREILSVHGALERSKNPQHSRRCPCIAYILSLAITFQTVKVRGTRRPVPLIVPARAQNNMLPQSICRGIRKVIPIQLDLHSFQSRHPPSNGKSQAHLCVCFLEHRLIVCRYTIVREERRYHVNRITPAERFLR